MGRHIDMSHPLPYLEHLNDKDLEVLARAGAERDLESLRSRLLERPELLESLLTSPKLFDAIVNDSDEAISPRVTPFLVFAVLVHHAAQELITANYIPEWTGPGKRLPVFDVGPVREFLSSGANRFFLIELLASFVKVASGSIWVRTRRGYRRRRYSELDPVQLAEMVDLLPPAQRAGGYRRLGDVTLFLSGVFPDHTATHAPAVSERERLAASAGLASITALDDGKNLHFHEVVGASWYRRAAESARLFAGTTPRHLIEVADEFHNARRFLNVLTDRYLFELNTGLLRPGG
jgi:hypothetical protein